MFAHGNLLSLFIFSSQTNKASSDGVERKPENTGTDRHGKRPTATDGDTKGVQDTKDESGRTNDNTTGFKVLHDIS